MKRYLFLIIGLFFMNENYAQPEIVKWSLAPVAGKQSGGTSIYIAGELANREVDNNTQTSHISEGFLSIDILALLDIQNYNEMQNVSVFPNPVKDFLLIELPESQIEIQLYDMQGKVLLNTSSETRNRVKLDMKNYTTGTYLLVLVDRKNKTYKTLKLVKK